MANDFRSARFWAAELIERALHTGAVAVDATMGNGHDTQWLCELVGEEGRVYSFDVQAEALERTRKRLCAAGLEARAQLILDGHQNMKNYVEAGSADTVMFNLGWLPGAQHQLTTRTESTLTAVQQALEVLREDGVMTICIYPGHEEGAREREALLEWAKKLDPQKFDTMLRCYLNQSADPPLMLAVKRNREKKKI